MIKMTLILGLLFSFTAFANEGPKEHPCKNIKAACEAAGFTKGAHKDKKGLFKDCMKPIMDGGTVAGVTLNPNDVQACKAKKAAHMEKRGHGKSAESDEG